MTPEQGRASRLTSKAVLCIAGDVAVNHVQEHIQAQAMRLIHERLHASRPMAPNITGLPELYMRASSIHSSSFQKASRFISLLLSALATPPQQCVDGVATLSSSGVPERLLTAKGLVTW